MKVGEGVKAKEARSPFQGHVNGLLVNAAAPLTDPAVVGQQLGPFLHLLQNLLPFLLNFGHRRAPAFPLLTWVNHSGADWATGCWSGTGRWTGRLTSGRFVGTS